MIPQFIILCLPSLSLSKILSLTPCYCLNFSYPSERLSVLNSCCTGLKFNLLSDKEFYRGSKLSAMHIIPIFHFLFKELICAKNGFLENIFLAFSCSDDGSG